MRVGNRIVEIKSDRQHRHRTRICPPSLKGSMATGEAQSRDELPPESLRSPWIGGSYSVTAHHITKGLDTRGEAVIKRRNPEIFQRRTDRLGYRSIDRQPAFEMISELVEQRRKGDRLPRFVCLEQPLLDFGR